MSTIGSFIIKVCSARLGCSLLASPLDAMARREVVVSPVRVDLVACVLSWWVPADYSPLFSAPVGCLLLNTMLEK